MKLAIVTGGFLPVPATKGGAVENLIQNFMNENEKYNDFNITIFSDFDENAKEEIERKQKEDEEKMQVMDIYRDSDISDPKLEEDNKGENEDVNNNNSMDSSNS